MSVRVCTTGTMFLGRRRSRSWDGLLFSTRVCFSAPRTSFSYWAGVPDDDSSLPAARAPCRVNCQVTIWESAGNAIDRGRAQKTLFCRHRHRQRYFRVSGDESELSLAADEACCCSLARSLGRCGCVMIVIKIASEDPKQSETQKRTPPIRFWLLYGGDYCRRCA